MKFSSVQLTAFKSWDRARTPDGFLWGDFDLSAPRIVVAGVNGAGKTSLREALKWVLTGRCQGLDGKGSGTALLAPTGTDNAYITAALDGVGIVTRLSRNGTNTFTVENMTGTSQIQQGALYGKLNVSPVFLDAALDSSLFLSLHHAEAKALLLDLLQVRVSLKHATYTITELDDAYKKAFEARAVEKKLHANTVVPLVESYSGPDEKAITAQLAKLRTAHDELVAQVGKTIGARKVLTTSLARLKGQSSPDIPNRDDLIVHIESELKALSDETVLIPGTVVPLQVLKSRLEAVERHNPETGCVFDETVQCKTPKKQFVMLASYLQKQIEAREAAEQPDPRPGLVKELATLKKEQADRLRAVEADTQRQADITRIEAELAGVEDTSELEKGLEALKVRILNGETLLAKCRKAQEALQAQTKAQESKARHAVEVARLEALCEGLGPSGARVAALESALAPFQHGVNASLKPYGWEIAFNLDPWKVMVNGRPVETYSRSEQHRIGIALQLAIASMSGVNFAIVDEMDMLDLAARKAMNQILAKSPVEQIILLGTREPDVPLPKANGVKSYRVGQQDGVSVVLEAA